MTLSALELFRTEKKSMTQKMAVFVHPNHLP